ncbi:unnamed protein product [Closterium sp. Yama58-4]|nr:unnamed protein product [Closterium sp. Yama58-4]
MVLVANEERVDVDGELSLLFLGRHDGNGGGARRGQVWRLQAALSGRTGWRGAFRALMGVLQCTGEQLRVEYEEHNDEREERLIVEEEKARGGGGGLVGRDGKAESICGRRREVADLLSFFQERVGKLVKQAREGAATLAQDLPSSLLPAHHRTLLLQAADLLPALLQVLACPGVAPADVAGWRGERGLGPRRAWGSSSITHCADASRDRATELFHAILLHLQRIHAASPPFNHLGLSSTPSWETIADACVKGARLALSTVSSSECSLIRLSGLSQVT